MNTTDISYLRSVRRWSLSQWIVLAATLLSALLVAIAVERPSQWVDERIALSLVDAPDPGSALANVIAGERRPPAWHLLLWAWSQGAGDTERSARLFSGLWAILLVPAVYQLARAFTSRKGAAYAALFAATAPVVISYGQTVRYYGFVAAMAALSFAAFFRLMQGRGRPWLAYAVSTGLLLYSDYPAYGVPLAQGLIGLLLWRRRFSRPHDPRRRWLAILVGLGLPLLLWVPVVLLQGGRDFGQAELSGGVSGVILRLGYSAYAWLVGETLFPWSPLAIAGLLAGLLLAVLGLRALRPRTQGAWWVAFGVPLLIAQILLATVAVDAPFVNAPPRSMACFGLVCVLVGAGLAALRRPLVLGAALVAVLGAHGAGLLNYYRGEAFLNTVYNTPAREVARAVAASAQPGDAIVGESDSVVDVYLPPALRAGYFDLSDQAGLAAWLSDHPAATVWQIELGRDRTRNPAAELQRTALLGDARQPRQLVGQRGFGGQDPLYRALKGRLLGREVYEYRLTVHQLSPLPVLK